MPEAESRDHHKCHFNTHFVVCDFVLQLCSVNHSEVSGKKVRLFLLLLILYYCRSKDVSKYFIVNSCCKLCLFNTIAQVSRPCYLKTSMQI